MTVQLYKAVVELPPLSELPEDVRVNDFYFYQDSAVPSTSDDIDEIQSRLEPFYNTIPTGQTKSLSDNLGDQLSRAAGAASIVYYARQLGNPGDPWGSPVGTRTWTLGTADVGTPLPAEIAIVLSFHGDLTNVPETQANPTPPPATIRPAARRRGRVYLGPWNSNIVAESTETGDALPTTAWLTTLAAAAEDLLAFNAASTLEWVVYSPTSDETFDVVGGFIDNAFDTQRRRGSAPTARTSWP